MSSGEQDWVAIAVLGRTRGNRGELTATSLTSKPERFETVERVFLSGHADPFRVEEIWEHKGSLVFKFTGIDSINDAERLEGCEVLLPWGERAALEAGEYYHSDLIGCEVFATASGQTLGTVAGVDEAAGGGLLVLENGAMIPFAKGLCKRVDVAARRIEVELPEGLLELNRP